MKYCRICSLPLKTLNLIHRLRFENGVSLRSIAYLINQDYLTGGDIPINNADLSSHFRRHVLKKEAQAFVLRPPEKQGKIHEPIPPDFLREATALHEKESRVLEDLERRFRDSQKRLNGNPFDRRGLNAHILIAREIRAAVETLARLQPSPAVVETAVLNILAKLAARYQAPGHPLDRETPPAHRAPAGLPRAPLSLPQPRAGAGNDGRRVVEKGPPGVGVQGAPESQGNEARNAQGGADQGPDGDGPDHEDASNEKNHDACVSRMRENKRRAKAEGKATNV